MLLGYPEKVACPCCGNDVSVEAAFLEVCKIKGCPHEDSLKAYDWLNTFLPHDSYFAVPVIHADYGCRIEIIVAQLSVSLQTTTRRTHISSDGKVRSNIQPLKVV